MPPPGLALHQHAARPRASPRWGDGRTPGFAAIERMTLAKLIYTDASGQQLSVPLGPEQDVVVVGRATDCHIRSNRKSVSRRHAEFIFQAGGFEVPRSGELERHLARLR